MQEQLSLNVALRDAYCFETFYPHAGNETLIHELSNIQMNTGRDSGNAQQFFIWGKSLSGKSHLLNAVCARVESRVQYLPLKAIAHFGADVLAGLEESRLIAVDDIDHVLGDAKWEEGFFNLINKMRDNGHTLIFTANENPRHIDCNLNDLKSRLLWGASYQLIGLSDEDAAKALGLRAQYRGMEIPNEVTQFLIKRVSRDMSALVNVLDVLDQKSLQEKSKVTIPFVKRALDL